VYYKGGLISNMIQYPDNRFEEFISDKNYTYTTSEGTITTKFEWDTEQSYYTKEASMYILKYGNRSLVMENIHNDTLVFHDQHMIDGMSSYCIKIN
jgi:hypothetical protein